MITVDYTPEFDPQARYKFFIHSLRATLTTAYLTSKELLAIEHVKGVD